MRRASIEGTSRARLAKLLGVVLLVWVAVLVLSLKTGWLNRFFYDTSHASSQGMDFFSVERGWLNLLNGRSEYDTFHSGYGPYASWLNYHPLLAIVVGAPLMLFSPWVAYGVWTGMSVALLAAAGWVIARRSADPLRQVCIVAVVCGSFPGFILLQSGNVQAVLVLAIALVLAALFDLQQRPDSRPAQRTLLAGLLLSLFSKPVVLALVPLLLLLRRTRRTTLLAATIYLPVSLLSLISSSWNPVPISWAERWTWITHPATIAQTMNVYTNGFSVTRPMLDNAVHWFAMIGLTDFRFLHVDIYSLSALLDGWLGFHTPDALYRLPILLVLEVTVVVALMRDAQEQMRAALMVAMAVPLLLLLSYGVVWEYHYTLALPAVAVLILRKCNGWVERAALCLGMLSWFPGLYVWLRGQNAASLHVQTILRAERVLPVLLMFLLLLGHAVGIALRSRAGLRLPGFSAATVD